MKVQGIFSKSGLLQARYSLNPRGILRFAISVPKGSYDRKAATLDIPSEIQQGIGPRCPWPARTKLRPGWGKIAETKPLSYKSKKTIADTLAAFDKEYGRSNGKLKIVTFTLPSVSVRAYQSLAAWASYAVNRLNTWLERELGEHARCGVWEWQKRGALHYHCVIGVDDPARYQKFNRKIKAQWIQILKDIGDKTGANMFLGRRGQSHLRNIKNIQVDVQNIKKSVAAYLSKYLSKGEGEKSRDGATIKDAWQARKAGCFYAPPRWANYNQTATELRKKYQKGGILLEFAAEKMPQVIEVCREFLEMVQLPGTKIIQTEGIGYAANCMYAIVDGWNDCIHAIDFLKNSLNKIIGASDWLSIEEREIEDREPFDEVAWEAELAHREKRIQKMRTFPELYRRQPSPFSAWDRLKAESLRQLRRDCAFKGKKMPKIKPDIWDRKYWNSCNENFQVVR